MAKNVKIITRNVLETQKIAEKLAKEILEAVFDKAVVIGLEGNLGGGKTVFTQGFAKALGVRENVLSPTFVILKKFSISNFSRFAGSSKAGQFSNRSKIKNFKTLIHIDAYRIDNPKEILDLGWLDLVADPGNIVLVEWADKIREILPKNFIRVKFKVIGRNEREIVINVKFKSQNGK